ncbi:NB-ARC and TPR domain protein [Xylaria digitata]|nr:NB-ARC and TPR domain protein [Xylaria digitata]
MRDLGHKIKLLNYYYTNVYTSLPRLKEICFEFGLNTLSLLTEVIDFMRSRTIGLSAESDWQPLENHLSSTFQVMDRLLHQVEELSTLAEIPNRCDGDGSRKPSDATSLLRRTSQSSEPAKLPCVILPHIKTLWFFDRVDFVAKIENHFKLGDPIREFQSLTLHGLSGVGKSTIALRYSKAKLERGELDASFWVHSKNLVTIRQSFTTIATQLRLPGARPEGDDENHAIVLDWLQHTQCRWLIIYDHAENIDLIHAHWPIARRGQALITSCSRLFASRPAYCGLEITTWDTEAYSGFLRSLLWTQTGIEMENNDTTSVYELPEKLNCHAFVISKVAGMIHRNALSIDEFMKMYRQYLSESRFISGDGVINGFWQLLFDSLNEHSSSILGLLCFLAPSSIPFGLLELKDPSHFPDTISFCAGVLAFSAAIENLLTLELIRRDEESQSFSLGRYLQTLFKNFLGSAKRQQRFNDVTILVSQAFPRRDCDVAQLYLMWDRCSTYLRHVLFLKHCFRDELKKNPQFTALPAYCDLSNTKNAYTDLLDLMEVNWMALNILSLEDQTIAHSYEIRSFDAPFNPVNDRESAWAAENIANGIATLNNFPEAIEWYEKARDHWQELVKAANHGMAMALLWSGDSARTRSMVNTALDQIESTTPYNLAMAAYTHFALGSIDRYDGMLEAAEVHFLEAQNLWLKGDQLRTDPFNAACMYRLGCTALDQGKVEAAVKYLQDARTITETRKDQMVAEHMRCLFKLSEALEQRPRGEEEARRLRETAEQLLHRLAPNAKQEGLDFTYDQQVYILWR